MKYFLDTEFIEGTQCKYVGNIPYGTIPNTIDLISIGIVAEDGREYYAISKEFNLREAWNRYDIIKGDSTMIKSIGDDQYKVKNYWIKNNVLVPIIRELYLKDEFCKWSNDPNNIELKQQVIDNVNEGLYDELIVNFKHFKYLIDKYGKTNKQIAKEIEEFVMPSFNSFINFNGDACNFLIIGKLYEAEALYERLQYNNPQFYGYYADYDWVVFCWLFGKMIDLPKGFPMYCIDLKQSLDQLIIDELPSLRDKNGNIPSFEEGLRLMKSHRNYPIQSDEHHSLKDAEWIHKLYNFLNSDIYGRN